jgi:hypothetical protein
MSATSLTEKVVAIDDALASTRLPHAFGGAIALAYYAEPRATIDVDVNVFVGVERVGDVAGALEPLGVAASMDMPRFEEEGQCRWWWERTPVDLFFSYDPLHEAMAKAFRRVDFADGRIPILSPEHLTVCKAVFDRAKDWIDIEQILVSNPDLDRDEIRGWLERFVGADDLRAQRFEELSFQTR